MIFELCGYENANRKFIEMEILMLLYIANLLTQEYERGCEYEPEL